MGHKLAYLRAIFGVAAMMCGRTACASTIFNNVVRSYIYIGDLSTWYSVKQITIYKKKPKENENKRKTQIKNERWTPHRPNEIE